MLEPSLHFGPLVLLGNAQSRRILLKGLMQDDHQAHGGVYASCR